MPDNKETRRAVADAAKKLEKAKKSVLTDLKPLREQLRKANEAFFAKE
jgi:hypothetical protein